MRLELRRIGAVKGGHGVPAHWRGEVGGLELRRIGAVKEGEQIVGNRTRIKVAKNKLAPPVYEVELDIVCLSA